MSDDKKNDDAVPVSLPSFSFVGSILLGVVLFFLGPVITKTGVLVLLLFLVAFVLWQAFSPGQYDKMTESYPEMARSFWIINNLIYHLVIPGGICAVVYLWFRFR